MSSSKPKPKPMTWTPNDQFEFGLRKFEDAVYYAAIADSTEQDYADSEIDRWRHRLMEFFDETMKAGKE